MKLIIRSIVLMLLLIGALVSYDYGFRSGTVMLVLLGIAMELAFWMGVFGGTNKKTNSANQE